MSWVRFRYIACGALVVLLAACKGSSSSNLDGGVIVDLQAAAPVVCNDMICGADEACVYEPCCETVPDGGINLHRCAVQPPPSCRPRPFCRGQSCYCFNPCMHSCQSVVGDDVQCGCGF